MLEKCTNLEDCERLFSVGMENVTFLGQVEFTKEDIEKLGVLIRESFHPERYSEVRLPGGCGRTTAAAPWGGGQEAAAGARPPDCIGGVCAEQPGCGRREIVDEPLHKKAAKERMGTFPLCRLRAVSECCSESVAFIGRQVPISLRSPKFAEQDSSEGNCMESLRV